MVKGHHVSFVTMEQRKPVQAQLVETDADVATLDTGRAREVSSLAGLLERCRQGNDASQRLGIEIVADYLAIRASKTLADAMNS